MVETEVERGAEGAIPVMVNEQINEVLWPDTPFLLRQHMVLCGRRGSESHGLYVPPTDPDAIDDRDLMGICIPPERYYLGLSQWEHAEAIKGPWDVVLYEVRKFVRLLCAQNPNVLCLLWLDPSDYLLRSYVGDVLIAKRDMFRCRKAAFNAFMGYAHAQLKKMTSFGEFRGYMGAKRKQLVEKHGFDTKNAAHALRLLHMGEEYLRTGRLNVRREHDRDELLAVKRGEVPLAIVQQRAEEWMDKCRANFDDSPLPRELDHETISEMVVGLVKQHLREERP